MDTKTILITGSTDGIGRAAALAAAEQGHTVIVHGRTSDRLAGVQAEIEQITGRKPRGVLADLSSLREVQSAATRLANELDQLDVLINNAGVISRRRTVSQDGYELTFAVNHLAPFLLTSTLIDMLRASAPARVVTVSSMVHRGARIDFDDLMLESDYDGFTAYGQSKLANVLFTSELARRLEQTGVTAVSLHPGVINTKVLHEYFSGGASVSEGAKNVLGPALDSQYADLTGAYFSGGRPEEPEPTATDPETARRLWEVSEDLCRRVLSAE
ncbi:MAG TPA: SDR family oxidoreductase [Alkalispirochaeta sp.]|nr:SDR family oxidoreductase [Alkalispirochaeta sp.]